MVSVRRRAFACAAASAALLLAACGATSDRVLHMEPNPRGAGPTIFFPPAPQVPRYFFAGQLIGEQNYVDANSQARKGITGALKWIAGLAAGEDEPEQLLRPQTGATDGEGRVYVTDASRQAVVVFEPTGGLQTWEIAYGGERFRTPVGLAVGPDRIFIADADLALVAVLDRKGRPLAPIGAGAFRRPTGVAFDAATGRLFVADTHAHDVKVFDAQGKLVSTLGRRGEGTGEFNFPTHVAYANGELVVADTMNSRVQVFERGEKHRLSVGTRGLNVGNMVRPKGVSVDSEGNLYVVESYYDHLLVYNREGQFLLGIGGLGKDAGQFYLPTGVWVDARNRVFVADMYNGRIVVLQFLGGDNPRT